MPNPAFKGHGGGRIFCLQCVFNFVAVVITNVVMGGDFQASKTNIVVSIRRRQLLHQTSRLGISRGIERRQNTAVIISPLERFHFGKARVVDWSEVRVVCFERSPYLGNPLHGDFTTPVKMYRLQIGDCLKDLTVTNSGKGMLTLSNTNSSIKGITSATKAGMSSKILAITPTIGA